MTGVVKAGQYTWNPLAMADVVLYYLYPSSSTSYLKEWRRRNII